MSEATPKVAVLGASGFVGSAVVEALSRRGAVAFPVRAPRIEAPSPLEITSIPGTFSDARDALTAAFAGADVVINCAGEPDAGSRALGKLYGANGVLPGVAGAAGRAAKARRYVHVSSAVVQGRTSRLDDSFVVDGFSAYARSKILGERSALDLGPTSTCVYRPPSVHAASRKVSWLTSRIAASPVASVAAPGTQNSPQAHIDNVGDVIAFLALTTAEPPVVVSHPSEGLTSAGLMQLLGGRPPLVIPRPLARGLTWTAEVAGRLVPAVAANARRVEMLWFGQDQAPSWAVEWGWLPVAGEREWQALAEELQSVLERPRNEHR